MKLLYFEKWNFLAPRLKNFRRELSKLQKNFKKSILKIFHIFSQKNFFLYFRK